MALDTFESIAGKVLLRCPAAGITLARDWVTNVFREIAERRRWSWLIKYGQFITPDSYTTGTVTCTQNSATVTGSGTSWTSSMVNRQFRQGFSPIYTIAQVNSATSLELEMVWGPATVSAVTYEIYQAYCTPPPDFHAFVEVWDPNLNWRLWRDVQQREIDAWDAQRANAGSTFLVAALDYTTAYNGSVGDALQVVGTGPDPVSTNAGNGYTGVNDAIFTVECTTGGATQTAVFKWKKDSGSYTTGVTTDPAAQDLSDGVQVYWPAALTFVVGDVWIIRCTAALSGGLPRYEFWPHKKSNYVFPYLYEARATDLQDLGATLPRFIRGDVILKRCLAEAAKWPGPSADKPNPYFNMALAKQLHAESEVQIMELERQDDETYEQSLYYHMYQYLPMAPLPWGSANWLQSHSI